MTCNTPAYYQVGMKNAQFRRTGHEALCTSARGLSGAAPGER
ncbi:hypothetical protein HMPREF0291_11400 [Corynebacterium genitalium ATCC 33030]|uniref:Uncharacterized protein n=1 Tax=Corynebacterium genitalium ATCC 33030 TaxID=585529 RepID=D7WF64_9CORY|nr:hypothetical protein HMPREF0291_11400 [Corynebacterium genitalium ATCC 33030]